MDEFVMPKLGLTMDDGKIIQWLKQEGETFEQGEPIVEVESDKATVEIEAPISGVVGKIFFGVDAVVPVGQVIAYILDRDEIPPTKWPALTRVGVPASESTTDRSEAASPKAAHTSKRSHHIKVSPVARKVANEMGIDLTMVEGSGPGGRITEKDVSGFIKDGGDGPESGIYPPSRLKRITGERLSASFQTAPHFYLKIEADAEEFVTLRERLMPEIEAETKERLSYTDLFLFLLARTLSDHQLVNACWEGGKIRENHDINLGVATAVEDGLIVPVIQNAECLELHDLVRERARLVDLAIKSKLTPEDLERGTFTFTNLGMFGIDEFSAILNPPQGAILAAGQIKKRPIAKDDLIISSPTVHLTLTVDHRVIDGVEGSQFLGDFANRIRNADQFL